MIAQVPGIIYVATEAATSAWIGACYRLIGNLLAKVCRGSLHWKLHCSESMVFEGFG